MKDILFYLSTKKKSIKRSIERTSIINLVRSIFYEKYIKGIKLFLKRDVKFNCAASIISAYINPYGDMISCTMWDKKIGNIKNNNFDDLWFSKENQRNKKYVRNGSCTLCWSPCEIQPSMLISLPWLL